MVAINIELGKNLLDRYEVVDFIESRGIKVEYSSLIRFYKKLSAKDKIGMFIRDTPILEETLLKCMQAFNINFIDILFKETEQGIRLYNPNFEGEREGFKRDNFCTFFYTD